MNTSRLKSCLKGGRSRRSESSHLRIAAATSRISQKWKWHYRRLAQLLTSFDRARRDHLREAAGIKPRLRRDFAENATDEFQRDMLLNEAASEQDAIYEIEQAVKRIENGTYGVCELTGEPISRARLRAIPWSRFSVSAERTLERNGSVHFQRLGQVASANAK